MSRYITTKAVCILVLVTLLLIAVEKVSKMIAERARYQETVIQEIAKSTSGSQTLIGPILVIPYQVVSPALSRVIEIPRMNGSQDSTPQGQHRRADATGVDLGVTPHERWHYYYALPQALHVASDALVAPRKLGVYQAQVYSAQMQFSGNFGRLGENELFQRTGVKIGQPYIAVVMSDTRGIIKTFPLTLNGQPAVFKEGLGSSDVNGLGRGVHALVNARDLFAAGNENNFEFRLDVQGTQNLSVVPLGRESDWHMQSNWQHPSFIGTILPAAHSVSSKGFDAKWQSNWFANNLNERFGDDLMPDLKSGALPSFSVNMIETVSQYQLNERTVKYAILFIGLVFISFVVFEAVACLKIHPVQYTLVGFALVMFYLLLLALSEHIGFGMAYALAAACSSGLIGAYLCAVLQKITRGALFSAGLALLYGLLYLILRSQDVALLFGSMLLFIILAVVMLATRKINWYQVTDGLERHFGDKSSDASP